MAPFSSLPGRSHKIDSSVRVGGFRDETVLEPILNLVEVLELGDVML